MRKAGDRVLSRRVATIIVVITTVVWLANFFAPFVMPTYKPDPAINGIYLAVIGGALALSRSDKGKGGDDPKPPGGEGS